MPSESLPRAGALIPVATAPELTQPNRAARTVLSCQMLLAPLSPTA